jgi:hypothetical protein
MSTLNQTKKDASQIGVDYCEAVFDVPGQQVVNTYKCDQRFFSVLDMWNIQRNRKEISVGVVGQTRIDLPLTVEIN